MQLLIVHSDAVIGAQLVQMMKDYTSHVCHCARSDVDAMVWARQASRCDFLIAQLQGDGVDGLGLGGALSELFPRLQTAFLPSYPWAEQRLEVRERKVFPEPIDGEALLGALARAETAREGAADLFHVVDVLQMCCLSGRDGAAQVVRGEEAGMVFLERGQLTHAETPNHQGPDALNELVAWEFVEFAYDGSVLPPARTIHGSWDTVLIDAVLRHKATKASQTVPTDWGGRQLGPYQIVTRIGEGHWGDVYEARQTAVERTVALQILRTEFSRDPAKVAEFMADARAKANVQHPRIISVYEAGEEQGTLFYARELIAGETLADRQRRNAKLTEAAAFEMIDAVAEAAAYLQQRKLGRIPITPDRVFLGADGSTRLINIAVADAKQVLVNEQSEMQTLGRLLTPMMTRTVPGPGIIPRLISRMQGSGSGGFRSWSALADETAKIDRSALTATASAR